MPDSKLSFDEYTEPDFNELESMVMALYEEDAYGEPMSGDKIRRTVADLQAHPEKGVIHLFRLGGHPVGFAISINFWSNEHGGNIIFIDELYLRPEWRSQGIGSAYINYIAEAGDKPKALQVEVTPVNKKSMEFFVKRGFNKDQNVFLFKKLRN